LKEVTVSVDLIQESTHTFEDVSEDQAEHNAVIEAVNGAIKSLGSNPDLHATIVSFDEDDDG
jgi:hypothetical protein